MKILLFTSLLSLSSYAFIPKEFSTKYTQSYKSKISNKTKKSSGVFDYRYPSLVKFKQVSPNEMSVTANTSKTWILTPGLDKTDPPQVRIGQSHNALSSFFNLLKNGLKTNKDYRVENDKLTYKLTFNDKNKKDLGISNVVIKFETSAEFKNIKKILIQYTDSREITLALANINTKPNLKINHFEFNMPKNAEIIRN